MIATSSTREKQALVSAAGAHHSISYADFPASVKQITGAFLQTGKVRRRSSFLTIATPGGAGVHAVFDGVGKDTFEQSLACLRKRGMCVLFGAASGQVLPPFASSPSRLPSLVRSRRPSPLAALRRAACTLLDHRCALSSS